MDHKHWLVVYNVVHNNKVKSVSAFPRHIIPLHMYLGYMEFTWGDIFRVHEFTSGDIFRVHGVHFSGDIFRVH